MRDFVSPRWRKVLRDALLHKARTLLVIVAIATAMTGAGALLDAWALVQRVTAQTYLGSHPVSATLHLEDVDAAMLARVRALPEVAAARARRTLIASAEVNGTRLAAELFSLQDFSARDIGRLQPEVGAWPPRDGELAIERSSLTFAGAALGEPLTLQVGAGAQRSIAVSGIVRDVGLPPGWMDNLVYAFVTPATLVSLGAPASFDELQIVVRDASLDREGVRRVAYAIKAQLELEGRHVDRIDVPEPGRHPHAAQMDSLMQTQGAFALLTLLVSCFLIVNLVSSMLAGQTREIGVMKALGATPRQIGAMYLAFAALLGAVASLVALPAALAIGRPYAALKADMLNFPINATAVPWWAIATQLLVGCVLPVLAAALPVRRACAMRVHAALCDTGIRTDPEGAFLRRRLSLPGIGRPLLLSLGNAFRRRERMLLTLLALAAGGAVFLGADNLRRAVRGSVDLLFASQHYDVVVRTAGRFPIAQLEAVALQTAGVERAQAFVGASASLVHRDGVLGDGFALVGLPFDSPLSTPFIEQGRWLRGDDRNVLVASRVLLRDEPTLVPGAEVTVMLAGKQARFIVSGVADGGPQALAWVPRAALLAAQGDDRAASLAVATRSPGDAAAAVATIARVRSALADAGMPVANSQLLGESKRVIEDHLLMVVEFLGAMAWVMIAVGGMGLASTMSLAVLERTREIGVMRAIGAPHWQIVVMLEVEGIVIALLGWVVSLPLSVPMSAGLAAAFERVMFRVPTQLAPSASGAAIWLLLSVGVAAVACAWPAWRATRVSAATALNYA
ncbi:MAG: FtsX-like permease family protein [Rudaea sp.]